MVKLDGVASLAGRGLSRIAIILAAASLAPATGQSGYEAELRKCVADMQASLHGRSILGSRDTAAYIQEQGGLENKLGVTEYDVIVGHCQAETYRRHANQSQRSPAQTAKRHPR
jgi:hypothetical protein